ncbi:hypothetical protein CDL15_Pgr016728 [Punica granatum]|uniref:Uncharacterized protein n=2 Tax=Punica granatum TaxID=22663 RepID=A0A218X6I9_PUNGR|nr:hypothetical protein CDL15_Pgr016728 [Punica granatum]
MATLLCEAAPSSGKIRNPKGRSPLTDSRLPHVANRALEAPEVVKECPTPSRPTMLKEERTTGDHHQSLHIRRFEPNPERAISHSVFRSKFRSHSGPSLDPLVTFGSVPVIQVHPGLIQSRSVTQIQEIRRQRDACIIQRLYFPEHPTDDERVFAATSAYVVRFYARGLASLQPSHAAPTPRATSTLALEAESSTQAAMHAELRAIREERDRLRCELVDSRAEVADYRELQTELTRARARVAHLDREMARLSAELDRVHKRARNLAHP